jgi:hypothetical protein
MNLAVHIIVVTYAYTRKVVPERAVLYEEIALFVTADVATPVVLKVAPCAVQ